MQNRSYLYILAAGSLWGLIGLFVRSLNGCGFSSMEIVTLRTIFSAAAITLICLKLGRRMLRIDWRDSWMFIGTGIFSLVFFNYCYFNSIEHTSLAAAVLMLYTAPIFVMLLSLWLFGEKFTPDKAVALIAAFVGCAFATDVFSSGLDISFKGLLYGLGSGFGYGLYSIFGKYAVARYSSLTITAWTFYFAVAAAVPIAGSSAAFWSKITFSSLWGIIGLSLVCAVIPYMLYVRGLVDVEPGPASIIATIEVLVASLVGVIVFGEPLTTSKIIGMVLIFLSVVILNLPHRRRDL